MQSNEVTEAIRRRALGYETDEVVEEYGFSEGEAVLVKRKVTRKAVPPDLQAAKMLLEEGPLSALSDEQLEEEKARLLRQLREEEEG